MVTPLGTPFLRTTHIYIVENRRLHYISEIKHMQQSSTDR